MNDIKISLKSVWYVPLIIIGFVFGGMLVNNVRDSVFNNYPLLKDEEFVNTIVLESDKYKGTTLINDRNNRFSVRAWTFEESKILHYHLEAGDSISRNAFSDTLFLFKYDTGEVILFEIQCLE